LTGAPRLGDLSADIMANAITSSLLRTFKETLTHIGSRMPDPALHQLQMIVNYMKLGRWMERKGFRAPHRVRNRAMVFETVAARIRDRDVLYLEFGVFKGESMRFWSQALHHPSAKLHGFDSFEGLPEDFDFIGKYGKGHFDVGGQLPQIDDARVKFFKGWFEQTVPGYQPPPHDVLVINLDADLFSATKLVLDHFRPWIKPGTLIYFDDMSRPDHEPRAFDEFMAATGRRFELVVIEQSMNRGFFECVA